MTKLPGAVALALLASPWLIAGELELPLARQQAAPSRALRAMVASTPMPDMVCVAKHCGGLFAECLLQSDCRKALQCNMGCQKQRNVQACDLLCELSFGYNSTVYHRSNQCMVDNHCFPNATESDGKCLATDDQTVKNLTDIKQVAGRWWILKGLNCGQEGWPAGFDWFPCQYDAFSAGPGGEGIDHIGYCGGKNNSCSTPMLRTVANFEIKKPGVLSHIYTDPPLKPQDEEWRVLSFPHPDWMLYIYCGSTPMGPYAGGSIVSKTTTRVEDIPGWVEDIFRAKAKEFKFDIDTMCISDTSACEDPFGPASLPAAIVV